MSCNIKSCKGYNKCVSYWGPICLVMYREYPCTIKHNKSCNCKNMRSYKCLDKNMRSHKNNEKKC